MIKLIIFSVVILLSVAYDSFWNIMLNGLDPVSFIAYSLFAYIGVGLAMAVDIIRREPKSDNSPNKFSFKYWWSDNRSRILVTLILIPVCIVLYTMLFSIPMDQLSAFMIGWSGDTVSELLKRKGILISNN